ncbi:MAG TPA: LPS assembly lipoprotein LptE [Pseudomonadales bacterium]|nr:LPS assembly lipoprotein LptE [Pseudomonadales bacterium]
MREPVSLWSGALALVLALGLAGCGFRPAGTLEASGLAGTRVIDTAGESEVAWALSRRLDLYGVPEPAANMGAERVLRLLDERFERRQVSVTGGARTAEYELVASATFELLGADGTVLIEPSTVRADAIYLRDRNNLLGSSGEERRLRDELRDDLVRRILSAVSVVAGSTGSVPAAS